MSPPIRVDFFGPSEQEVFSDCIQKNFGATEVVVKPLERFGYSGARVFVFYTSGGTSRPWIGKIHNRKGIREEIEGLDRARDHFEDARHERHTAFRGNKGILCISLISSGGSSDMSVTELKDLLFEDPAKPRRLPATKSVQKILTKLYRSNCDASFKAARFERQRLKDQYEWYLRGNRARPLFENFFGKSRDKKLIEIYGRPYPNPLKTVDSLLQMERQLQLSTVHGDLHPSNVVLDRNRIPRLIDFSWCRKNAHVLQDFLLMECSIRFLMAPRAISSDALVMINAEFLKAPPFDSQKVLSSLKKMGVTPEMIGHFDRTLELVTTVRQHAMKVCGSSFNMCDYLACQAIVLYGLCRVEKYPFEACVNALGLIGEKLKADGYFGSR